MRPISKELAAKNRRFMVFSLIAGLFISAGLLLYFRSPVWSVAGFFSTIILIYGYVFFKANLDKSARIKKIETIFPDFLQLMSSNLRAGMTIDKAILLSSRPEFTPLDEELLKTGRDIATSRDLERALLDLSRRIGSENIHRTIQLIISGIKSGGDLAILLEETSGNMREKDFMQKKASSNVLTYVIFIFLVVAIFSPALFSLSNVLVQVLSKILGNLPKVDSTSMALPFTLSKVSISMSFITYFSILFIIVIDVLACLVLGLVSKGEEKQGMKYLPAVLVLSLLVFFGTKLLITNVMSGLI